MNFESKEQAYRQTLHLYADTDAILETAKGVLVHIETSDVNGGWVQYQSTSIYKEAKLEDCLLHLRSYSSMTDAEALEFARLTERHVTKAFYNSGLVSYKHDRVIHVLHIGLDKVTPAQFLWLLKHGFDVFGLIKLGYAKELKQ